MLSSAELARVSACFQQSQTACCLAKPGSLRPRTRFKQSCVVACRFRVSCTLYLQFPCAASCLRTCKNMQCNVPEGIRWRLQTPKFAPQSMHASPFPGLGPRVRVMKTSYSMILVDNKMPHPCMFSWTEMRKSLLTIIVTHISYVGIYIRPEMAASHMMARTRSSHQTLKKRLMKQAMPYNNIRVNDYWTGWPGRFESHTFPELLARGFQMPFGRQQE